MVNLKLKSGFLVKEWTGEIIPINYTIINYLNFGNLEERFLFVDANKTFYEPTRKCSSDKVFDIFKDAEEYSKQVKKDVLIYLESQIKHYEEKVKEYKSETNKINNE
jgi:hypothetical protein